MPDVDYIRPCRTKVTRDNFAAHVARGSVLPGLDFACNTGDSVFASADGRVMFADSNPNQVRGRNIIIKHRDGKQTHYLHLSKVGVKNGDKVLAGDKIGESGNSGTTSTGPHLHFSIKNRFGKCIDPAKLLRKEKVEARLEAEEVIPPLPTHLPPGS